MKHFEYILSADKKFIKQELTCSLPLAEMDIRVRPILVGICGSDLYHYLTYQGPELRPGHEWIGNVVEVGAAVTNFSIGDTVTSSATLGCGRCRYCQNLKVNLCENPLHLGSDKIGALRSDLVFNSFNALKLNSSHKSEVLIEVMAVAEEAIRLMKSHTSSTEESVLVLGAGTVGILIAIALRAAGKKVAIADINISRVKRAKNVGLDAFMLNQLLMLPQFKNSFGVVFDATADRDNNKGGLTYLPYFGKKNLLAIVIGKYTKNVEITPDAFARTAAQLVFMRGVPLDTLQMTIKKWSGKLEAIGESLVTHTISSSELVLAFGTALDTSLAGKVVIEMSK